MREKWLEPERRTPGAALNEVNTKITTDLKKRKIGGRGGKGALFYTYYCERFWKAVGGGYIGRWVPEDGLDK